MHKTRVPINAGLRSARGTAGQQSPLQLLDMERRRNGDNLVLREDVCDDVAEGQFHVWAIDGFEEAWSVLTGIPAGDEEEEGVYPPGFVYRAVTDQLDAWTHLRPGRISVPSLCRVT